MSTSGHNYLGIDLGTSEVKVLIMSEQGSVLAVAHSALTWEQPAPGWAEQDPASWWNAVIDACKQLQAQAPELYAAVNAIGLSGQMHGATLLDEQHNILRPCILWNDARSAKQCEELTASFPQLHSIAGNLAMPGFTAPKIAWLQANEPTIFKRIATVLLPTAHSL